MKLRHNHPIYTNLAAHSYTHPRIARVSCRHTIAASVQQLEPI